jgi:hypothetical protein
VLGVDQGSNNPPGNLPAVTKTVSAGTVTLSWPAATDPDGDPIRFYRIYRDGSAYADRYDRVDGNVLSYTDPDPNPVGNTYYVTAVDSHFSESDPTQAVGP